jgi:hypothetical protein
VKFATVGRIFVAMMKTREQRLDHLAGELAKELPFDRATMRWAIESYGAGARAAAEVAAATGGLAWPPTKHEVDAMFERARQRALSYG